jgi:hypothetical protein
LSILIGKCLVSPNLLGQHAIGHGFCFTLKP